MYNCCCIFNAFHQACCDICYTRQGGTEANLTYFGHGKRRKGLEEAVMEGRKDGEQQATRQTARCGTPAQQFE